MEEINRIGITLVFRKGLNNSVLELQGDGQLWVAMHKNLKRPAVI